MWKRDFRFEVISGSVSAEDGRVDENDGVGFVAKGPLSRLEKQTEGTLKWMGLLFGGTLLLLIFQLLLGWLARSVSLIADSAHTGADVFCYGLNLWTEWIKLSISLGAFESESAAKKVASNARRVDTIGTLASLAVLIVVEAFSVLEALDRLRIPSQTESNNHIGRALLAFAIISTALNIFMLVMYRHWHRKAGKSDSDEGEPEPEAIAIGTQNPQDADEPNFDMMCCQPCMPENMFAIKPARKQAPFVNLEPDKPSDDETEDAPTSKAQEAVSTLHMLIHPGCQCSGKVVDFWGPANLDADAESGSAGQKAAPSENAPADTVWKNNLNVIAATLHLFTDVLRGIAILCVAILIQVQAIQDAEYADAICALIVAALILLGSMALVLQLFGRLHSCCRLARQARVEGSLKAEVRPYLDTGDEAEI
jgi:cation diffusion facilitator family transporter